MSEADEIVFPGMTSSDVHISDVIDVINTDPMFRPNEPGAAVKRPEVIILEEPAAKALRFRYECEGRSAGSIPGARSTPENKTFPTIQIVGHNGPAVVVVSCVTKDSPYKPHPHNLVGKEGCSRGVCTLKMNSGQISFSNLGIQCVKKKDIEAALQVREDIRVDPFRTGFSHRSQHSNIDLNSVRLCFQVFLEGNNKGEFTVPLKPVVSEPIYDKKAMSDLTISKLSDCSASVAGGRQIILLCEKVAKEDIQVRFFEEVDGNEIWEGLADFTPADVHKQVAISFRTPKYRDLTKDKAVKVWIQLLRPSDKAVSEPVRFMFTPLDADSIASKRKRPKMGGEASPQNFYNPNFDDDSRSTYGGSPDRLQVKHEPPEASPSHYGYAGNLSPMYQVPSPGRAASNSTSPIPYSNVYANITNQQFKVLLPGGGGGAVVGLNPALAGPSSSHADPLMNDLSGPVNFFKNTGKNNLFNMDTQQYENNVDNYDSGKLADMVLMTDVDLSENLSCNLTLSDQDRPQDNNAMMSDSCNNVIQELVSLSYPPPSQP